MTKSKLKPDTSSQAQQELEEFKPHADTFRTEHLKQLARAIALRDDTNEESEFKKLTNQEYQRKVGAKLRAVSKKGRKGLARKLLTGPKDNEQPVEEKLGLEVTSAEENEDRFTKCLNKSEFVTDPELFEAIGLLTEGPEVDNILDGTYPIPEHLSWHTQKFLEFLPMPEVIQQNPMPPPEISLESHIQGWRKTKESTSSDPHNPDFSHYISASYDAILADMDRTVREIPLQYGFAPDEWNPMADCSIPKKENKLRADEMRTIVLKAAQYNMNNKWYGREFMQHNEALGTIPDEQEGSRKGHQAALVVLKKVLAMDLLCQQRRAGFLCSNDAIQCYDRILHNVAILSMR